MDGKTRSLADDRRNPVTRGGQGAALARSPTEEVVAYAKHYARERPEVVALWCHKWNR